MSAYHFAKLDTKINGHRGENVEPTGAIQKLINQIKKEG